MDTSPLCRICLSSDSPQNMISPCSCTGTSSSGTQKYVHEACLDKWQEVSPVNLISSTYCPVCKSSYALDPKVSMVSRLTLVLGLLFFTGVWFRSYILMGGTGIWMLVRWSGIRVKIMEVRDIQDSRGRHLRLIRSGNPISGLRSGLLIEATDSISSGIFHKSKILILFYTYRRGAVGLILGKSYNSLHIGVRVKLGTCGTHVFTCVA